MTPLSPSYDNKIARKYSAKTLEHKRENKLALQEELKWIAEPKRPMVCIPSALTEANGGALMEEMLAGLLSQDIELLVRGKGSEKYGKLFTKLMQEKTHKIAIIPDTDDGTRKMLAAAEIALFFAEPSDEELKHVLGYGVVPVCLSHALLENYNPVQEAGNAFIYKEANVWHCFGALVRALETLKFPFDWRTIQRHAMETVES